MDSSVGYLIESFVFFFFSVQFLYISYLLKGSEGFMWRLFYVHLN